RHGVADRHGPPDGPARRYRRPAPGRRRAIRRAVRASRRRVAAARVHRRGPGHRGAGTVHMSGTAVHLVRHGRTAWHRPNRYAGRSDIDLDDTGVAQARRLAGWAARARLAAIAT